METKICLTYDLNNLSYRNIHVSINEDKLCSNNYQYWKHLTLNNILKNIHYYRPHKVIFALDAKNYWRKDIYPLYKSSRKAKRESSKINFDEFFPIRDEFFSDMKEVFSTMYFLEVERCEADDIIAILTKYILPDYSIINISADKDMHQLLQYSNYEQYNPLKKDFVSPINHMKELELKLIMGDRGDDIPNISGGKLGIVTATKILNNNFEIFNEEGCEHYKENYERNKQLIDFNYIPKQYIDSIKNCFYNYPLEKINGRKINEFLDKHMLPNIQNDMIKYFYQLKNLI